MTMVQVQRMAVERWGQQATLEKRFVGRDVDYDRHNEVLVNLEKIGPKHINCWRAAIRSTAVPIGSVLRSDIATKRAFHFTDMPLYYRDQAQGRVPLKSSEALGWIPILRGIKSTKESSLFPEVYERSIHSDGLCETRAVVSEKIKTGDHKSIHVIELLVPIANTIVMASVFRRLLNRPTMPFALDIVWNVPLIARVWAPFMEGGLLLDIKPHVERNHLNGLVLANDAEIGDLWTEIQREFFQSFGHNVGNLYPIEFEEIISSTYEQARALY